MSEKPQELVLKDWQIDSINKFTQKGLALKAEAETLKVEEASDLVIANQTFKRAQSLRKEIDMDRKAMIFPFQDFVKQVNVLAAECSQPGEQAELIISQKILAYNEKVEVERRAEAEKEKQRLEDLRLKEEAEKKARDEEEARLRKIEEDRLESIRKAQEEERKKIAEEQDANKRAQAEIEAKRLEEEGKLEAERIRLEQQKREQEEKQKEIDAQKAEMDRQIAAAEEKKLQDVVDAGNKVKGLRTAWTYEVEDENAVVRELCSPDSKKINLAIKNGMRVANGLRIYQEKRIQ